MYRAFFEVSKDEEIIPGYPIEILTVALMVGVAILVVSKKKFKRKF